MSAYIQRQNQEHRILYFHSHINEMNRFLNALDMAINAIDYGI